MSLQDIIVVTTIFEPKFLAGYLDSIEKFGRSKTTGIVVIIDKKTPASVAVACAEAKQKGFHVFCPTLSEQEELLAKWGAPADYIPYNTDNRRNIGFLLALELGCERMISIDDDNFCLPGNDFIGDHGIVGSIANGTETNSSDPWFNICSLLKTNVPQEIFARGFPYAAQRAQRSLSKSATPANRIGLNAGLWLDDPDVDALYRLSQRPSIVGTTGENVLLGNKTWSPINTQNTALIREAIAGYYYVRMGFALKGLTIDRFGDILSGYLVQKCLKHCGYAIRLGTPAVDHKRTTHNLFKDLYHELAGIVLIEEFVPWLQEVKLSGGSIAETYADLATRIGEKSSEFKGFIWDDGGRDFLLDLSKNMQTWLKLIQRIGL